MLRKQLGWRGEREGDSGNNGAPFNSRTTASTSGGRGEGGEFSVHRRRLSRFTSRLAAQRETGRSRQPS